MTADFVRLGLAVIALIAAYLFWRSRASWPRLPEWTWNDIRKNVALVATIFGAAVITAIAWGLLDDLVVMAKGLIGDLLKHTGPVPPPREIGAALDRIVASITWGLKLLLVGVIVVLLSLGFVITPRRFDFHGPGNTGGSFSGGDGEAPAPPPAVAARAVATAAGEKAEEIAEAAGAPKGDDPAIPEYAKP